MKNRSLRVVITGANRGLGLEFVRRYLKSGARVVATARDPEAAQQLRALAEDSDGRLSVLPLDVASADSITAFAKELPFDSIDILINNAGVGGDREQSIEEIRFDSLEDTLRINALGPLRITQALWDRFSRPAKVVHVTSLMGSIADNSSGGRYAYRMSKAALNMAVRSLGHECEVRDVTTFAIHPGWVRTDMGGDAAPLSIEESVGTMIATIQRKQTRHNGGFFDREGHPLPW
jgi:NAD(P)-dependent dehydrogenase (short-subunit alcohol dehydrogenase family)